MGKGETVVSWAHQRSRELADQLLDDAHSFRQRCFERLDGLRRVGLATVYTVRGAPFACREQLEAFALVLRRAGSIAVTAALDLAWLVRTAAAWMRARRRRIVALAAAPVVLALALVFVSSSAA